MYKTFCFVKGSGVATAILLFLSAAAWAFAPSMVNYQGYLTDSEGAPLDTTVQMIFSVYDEEGSTTALWDETHTAVTVTDGIFDVQLGVTEEFGSDLFEDATMWLGITLGDNSEMTPRIQFTSVPYAYRIATVDGAAGGTINGKLNVGTGNTNSGMYAMVAGLNNHADGNYSVVAGGGGVSPMEGNSAGYLSVIGGGRANIAGDDHCVVSGGFNNTASDDYATVGGGIDNTASGYYGATVAGGSWNEATGQTATVSGGRLGRARGAYSVVAGGGGEAHPDSNSAVGDGSVVSGGSSNAAFGIHSVISGGRFNRTRGFYSVVGGGGSWQPEDSNSAVGNWSTVSGGRANVALGEYGTIGGGLYNEANGMLATVAGGSDNKAGGYSSVGGGYANEATGEIATIAGGWWNYALGSYTTVGGGCFNYARGYFSTIGGGGGTSYADSNSAAGFYSTIGGGRGNYTGGECAFVGGGRYNDNRGSLSVICGGGAEQADSANYCDVPKSFIGGGANNRIDSTGAIYGTIGGGCYNVAADTGGTVPGGIGNAAYGTCSFAAGYNAQAWSDGAFVWADRSTHNIFNSTVNNQFNVRAAGGTRIFSNSATSLGAQLLPNATAWTALSDSTKKTDIHLVDTKAVLDKVAQLPIKEWRYKEQPDPTIRHMGPMAQDFWSAFHLGEDSLGISTIDPDGVALAAIQELLKQNQALEARVAQLEQKLSARSEKETQTALNTINKR